MKTILAQYQNGSITVDDVKELIHIASMLQSSECDKQPANITDNINKMNSLIQMSIKNDNGGNGALSANNAQQQQQNNSNTNSNNQNFNQNLIPNYNDN